MCNSETTVRSGHGTTDWFQIGKANWLLSKNLQTINSGACEGKREPSYTVGGNAN